MLVAFPLASSIPTNPAIRDGLVVTGAKGVAAAVLRAARKAVSQAARGWAACLGRIFEVCPIKCSACGGEMKAISVITEDEELDRLLAHLHRDL